MSTMEIDENVYWDRMEEIASKCADDVMMIQKLADGDGHAAAVSRQLLAVLDNKSGSVDLIDLRHLDLEHRAAAMRLIELCSTPSLLPDAGLPGILANA